MEIEDLSTIDPIATSSTFKKSENRISRQGTGCSSASVTIPQKYNYSSAATGVLPGSSQQHLQVTRIRKSILEQFGKCFLITTFMNSRKISLISFVTRLHDLANTIDQISEIRSPGDLAANEKAPPHYMIPNQLENLLPSHHRNTHHQSQHPKR